MVLNALALPIACSREQPNLIQGINKVIKLGFFCLFVFLTQYFPYMDFAELILIHYLLIRQKSSPHETEEWNNQASTLT